MAASTSTSKYKSVYYNAKVNNVYRSHIKKAFLKVFAQIDILIDAQVRKAKDKGHKITVSIPPMTLLFSINSNHRSLYLGNYSCWWSGLKPISLRPSEKPSRTGWHQNTSVNRNEAVSHPFDSYNRY